jgi:uncharacterized membrane protein (UPF0127 family)
MKTGWFVLLAGSFYFFVVALFWPVEKKILPTKTSATSAAYQHGTVVFSDTSVQVEIPTTQAASELGLGGRTNLADTAGMLWLFDPPVRPSFWMKRMKIPLDFIWIKQNQVVDITPDVPPPANANSPLPIYEPSVTVDAVLEVRAGFGLDHHIQVGDTLRLDRD